MPARTRKLIGGIGLLLFVFLYVGAAGWIGARLPPSPWMQLAYYAIVGIGWGVPVLPLLSWMNGADRK